MKLPFSTGPGPGLLLLASLITGLTLAACRKEKRPTTTAPSATATAPAEQSAGQAAEQAANKPWSEMNHAEQMAFMQNVVTPKMAASFQAHDAEEFADFNCATCHGPSAAEGNFEMPTAALPRLGDFEVAKQEHPKGMAFMIEQVTPQMADLLQMPPFDPKTQKGFGCFGCHLPAQAAG